MFDLDVILNVTFFEGILVEKNKITCFFSNYMLFLKLHAFSQMQYWERKGKKLSEKLLHLEHFLVTLHHSKNLRELKQVL